MDGEKINLDDEFNLTMYKTLLSSLDKTERFRFLAHQAVLAITQSYPVPGELVDKASRGRGFVGFKFPVEATNIIAAAFNSGVENKNEVNAFMGQFFLQVFCKGLSLVSREFEPDTDRGQAVTEVFNRLKNMVGADYDQG